MSMVLSILVVDDQKIVRDGIKGILENEIKLFSVIYEAGDGEEALDIIVAHKPDIILLDIMMPKSDGFDLLKVLKARNLSGHVIIISSHTDFSFAQKALEFKVEKYITKPLQKDEMERAILDILSDIFHEEEERKVFDEYKNKSYSFGFFEFLRGNDVYADVNVLASELGITQNRKKYFTIALFITAVDAHQIILSKIDEYIKSYSSNPNGVEIGYLKFENPGGEILIILTHDCEITTIIQEILVKVSETAIDYHCGISSKFIEANKLSDGYIQSRTALTRAIEDSSGSRHVFYSTLETKFSTIISKTDCDNFVILMKKHNKEAVLQYFDEMFYNMGTKAIDSIQLKKALISFVNYVAMSINESMDLNLMYDEIREKINIVENRMEIKLIIKKYYSEICEMLESRNTSDSNLGYIINKMLEFINDNYMENFSLSDLARKYNVSYTYLSNLFSKQMGEPFIDYLLKVRLEKARTMLSETNEKIMDVATQSGFSSSTYFCKIFKKTYKISPIEYRNLQ